MVHAQDICPNKCNFHMILKRILLARSKVVVISPTVAWNKVAEKENLILESFAPP